MAIPAETLTFPCRRTMCLKRFWLAPRRMGNTGDKKRRGGSPATRVSCRREQEANFDTCIEAPQHTRTSVLHFAGTRLGERELPTKISLMGTSRVLAKWQLGA